MAIDIEDLAGAAAAPRAGGPAVDGAAATGGNGNGGGGGGGGCGGAAGEVEVGAGVRDAGGDPSARAEAVEQRVPGAETVYVRTFGCAHNVSDGETMAGTLAAAGYRVVGDEERGEAHAWVVNSCTVKGPSQAAMANAIKSARDAGKAVVVAGCVPQGDPKSKELDGLSLLGVTQIGRVAEVVGETLKGNSVRLLKKGPLPSLDLPKIRRNAHVEIVPVNAGCLGSCTYCKTKHARGDLKSYPVAEIVARVKAAAAEGVSEVWLSSEDTGAYGIDIGTDVGELLRAVCDALPPGGGTMLRLGMTNPPYILEHLDAIAEAMLHPCVFEFLHLPVQSGSNAVLERMNREYTAEEFERCADALLARVPNLHLATDVIAGFPGETEEDFEATVRLVEKYR